jgi:hypothetical protein
VKAIADGQNHGQISELTGRITEICIHLGLPRKTLSTTN